MESSLSKISRKTGKKPISCKCAKCKSQCLSAPCLGTPQDIEKIIDAGFSEKIFQTEWAAGVVLGVHDKIIPMFQAEMTPNGCVFLKNGLCSLHDIGLKPTEGKLSHHDQVFTDKKKLISLNVAKEWLLDENKETISRIKAKLISK